jgi:signal transduction histidine kinase
MLSKGSALPPRKLGALIVGITVVPLATLLWLGWRLLEQDRMLEGQQVQQRVERAADLAVAALQRALSSSEQRLADGSRQWPEGAAIVTFHDGRVEAYPKERVAYLPVVPPLREAPGAIFAGGEDLEFRRRDYAAAVNLFRDLAKSPDAAVRAGALLRLGRNLHSAGRTEDALAAYTRLSELDGVSVAGAPAGLIGRYARCKLLEETKRGAELRLEAQRLESELHSGRWALTGPVYWLYAGDAVRWSGAGLHNERQAEIFAAAVATLWKKWNSMPPSGRECLVIDGQTVAALWQTSAGSLRALLAGPSFVETQWLAAIASVVKEQRITFGLRDPEARIVFGKVGAGAAPKATRSAAEAALPWSVLIASSDPPGQDRDFAQRRRLLIGGFILLVSMALVAGYLIVRAVSRELAVARLQSDFVAAVSHEFRTPLTALRQFTDRLREHGALDEDRRRVCYEAQSRATDRLTRLVESLLDFGRMEAGAHPYRFEPRDCGELVRRVVEDFRGEAQAGGYQVELRGAGAAQIEMDCEALSRAVWNLLDNAVKYSPDHHTVEVDLKRRNGGVRIAVRDHGIGIPAHERRAIFAKFHRGELARTRGIKGTGIGLAMVDHIVKAHHGRVEVESEPGKGSTFTIVLPAKD